MLSHADPTNPPSSLSPGLRTGPTVWQRDLLRRQPLAAGAADVHPPGAGGGRVPPLQSQGTGVGMPSGAGRGDEDRAKGTQLLAWEKSSIKALRWRRGSALGGGRAGVDLG